MTISSINLTLRADTTGFSASIRQAEQEFSSRMKRMGNVSNFQSGNIAENFKSLSGQLRNAVKQLTIFAGAMTGLGLLGKHMLEAGDRTAVMADRLGMSTSMLQEMRFAATQTGASTEQLESAFGQFNKQLGAVSQRGSITGTAFERLGVSVLNADGSLRSSTDVLYDVADALQGIDSQAERASLTTALFGRQGAALSLLLAKGASGIEAYREQARSLGIVIDDHLVRQAEKASSQLNAVSFAIKSQLISAFAELSPHVLSFSQKLLTIVPNIKILFLKVIELKEGFIYLAKIFLSVKAFQLSGHILSLAKSFRVVSNSASYFTGVLRSLGTVARSAAIGVALISVVEGLNVLKQHLDFKKETQQFIQSQHTITDATRQFAGVQNISAHDFFTLSSEEQKAYRARLKSAQQFWHAKLTLEARENSQSSAALYAAKQNRLLLENISEIEMIFKKNTDLEKQHNDLLRSIREEEGRALKQHLSTQLKAFDEANQKLATLKEKRRTIATEFRDLVREINMSPKKSNDALTVLDIGATQNQARQALAAGDLQNAMQLIQRSKEIIRELANTEQATKAYLSDQANVSAKIADDIVQAEMTKQTDVIETIKAKITEIKSQAEWLKHVSVEFDSANTIKSADEMRSLVQAHLSKNPLKIPTVVIPSDATIDSRVDKILSPQKKARGGIILGPGTETSDSILARLSRGEYVIRAAAVKHYGARLLAKINHMQLPRYARGGMVTPILNKSTPSSSVGHEASLTLNLGNAPYTVRTSDIDVVQALTKAVAREALKSGRMR